jgi:hypothetical protein
MAPPSIWRPPRAEALRAPSARPAARLLLLAASLGIFGCQRTVDIASVQDPTWVATTIPYTGVREPTRQFPDYSSIDASILKNDPKPAGKKGAPR